MAPIQCIMGMGNTGLSCLRFLRAMEKPCCIMDSRANPPGLQVLLDEFPEVPYALGGWRHDWLMGAGRIIVSPGIALTEPCLLEAKAAGITICGDIELVAQCAKAPVVGITGTNGKTTVTSLTGELLATAGKRVAVGGNLGPPALELLTEDAPEIYVLELSSFQLASTSSLHCKAATLLNCSPDHLDWHPSYEDYMTAKKSIYHSCDYKICARHDPNTMPHDKHNTIIYGLDAPISENDFGLTKHRGEWCLVKGEQSILPLSELALSGPCPELNALAACALVSQLGVSVDVMTKVLSTYVGLPHRCEKVVQYRGVDWYNDSKGTNIGATSAAVQHLSSKHAHLILLMGGVGKGADFSVMQALLKDQVRHVILFGQDGLAIQQALRGMSTEYVSTLSEAVQRANQVAKAGEAVLFSPSCASFDAFENFAHRGNVYKMLVKELVCS